MKNKILLLLSLALCAPVLTISTTGCTTGASSSAQATVYKTLQGVGETVDVAMTQAAAAYHNGQLTAAQWQEIGKVHADYIVAYRLAVDAGATSASPAPDKVIALSTRLAALIASYVPKPV